MSAWPSASLAWASQEAEQLLVVAAQRLRLAQAPRAALAFGWTEKKT